MLKLCICSALKRAGGTLFRGPHTLNPGAIGQTSDSEPVVCPPKIGKPAQFASLCVAAHGFRCFRAAGETPDLEKSSAVTPTQRRGGSPEEGKKGRTRKKNTGRYLEAAREGSSCPAPSCRRATLPLASLAPPRPGVLSRRRRTYGRVPR